MEKNIVDSLNNTITLTYDANTDVVKVKNSGVDSDFREITRQSMWTDNVVIGLETPDNGDDNWENYTDSEGKSEIRNFWLDNKINQD